MSKTIKCQGLIPRGATGFKQCEKKAEWVMSHNEEKNFSCDDHIRSLLSDKTMNIILPIKKYLKISKKK